MAHRRMKTPGAAGAALLLLAACEDMAQQPGTAMDERATAAAEPIPAGTVPRGWLEREARLAAPGEEPLDVATLRRGKGGFDAFCSPCHGRTGQGDGMVVRHGFPPPASLHSERLRAVPRPYIVQVITQGLGRMPSYANRVEPDERWAIAAYVEALQLSQGMPLAELPAADRERLPARPGS